MGEKMGTVVNFQNVYCFSELKTFASIFLKIPLGHMLWGKWHKLDR